MRRIGVDTGGTFTDLLLIEGESLRALKVPSTPDDPAKAVLEGLSRLGGAQDVVHGSTVGTNALLERRGARTALVTTRGFADVLEIGRQARPRLYQLEPERPEPLVPRGLRFEVAERLAADGRVLQAPEPAGLEALADELRRAGVESVAVCLLHAYRSGEHEEIVARALDGLEIPVSLSHQVLREYREFERFSATAVNAYIRPRMASYLRRLREDLSGSRLRIMRSNGGSLSAEVAAREPVHTILSGPAGGVVGASFLGGLVGEERIITFDMGGTSTDVALLDGRPRLAGDLSVGDIPLRVPVLDIHTVGAGGGSIAWIDEGSALRVGPRSAGADPGPACYGRGDQPTVTDANLGLGRIRAESFLGGTMRLDKERARACLERFAERLSLEPRRAAAGVIQVAESTMEEAIRVISLARGHDPARFTLYCYGGAGGLHVAALARSLGIPKVRIPRDPGLFSALGMLASDVVVDLSETLLSGLEAGDRPGLEAAYRALEERALEGLEREGFARREVELQRTADLRYRGQSFELSVDYGPEMDRAFHAAHRQRYGHARTDRPVEVVQARVRAIGRVTPPVLPSTDPVESDGSEARVALEPVVLGAGEEVRCPVLDRERLRPGARFEGPALVVEYSSTTWVPPGTTASVDRWGSLVLEVRA